MENEFMVECPEGHTVQVKLKKEEGLKYYICPICDLIVGLKNRKESAFIGYNHQELMELWKRKKRMKYLK